MVSVVMLNYNSGENLYSSIESVLKQDYYDVELVIADDASNEFDAGKVQAFIDENNKNGMTYLVIANKENMGTVKNINNAVRHCNGDIIINLSAGDIFFPLKLSVKS